jgi:pyruvyltransferase
MKTYYYDNGHGNQPKKWSLNWGDVIGPTIVKHFSKSEKIEPVTTSIDGKLVTIGSVMEAVRGNDLVWGTGIIRNNSSLSHIGNPNFFAVRGPLTRDQLIKKGLNVPEVYGDPGLLYPQIYSPNIEKTHEWGIIPHYIDANLKIVEDLKLRGVKVIDICAGEKEFINQLLSVEKVLSSTLHGLIAADSYGIPNARITLSDRIVGGDFKFMDYSLSVNRGLWKGTVIKNANINLDSISLNYKIDWDPDLLLSAAPWNDQRYEKDFY